MSQENKKIFLWLQRKIVRPLLRRLIHIGFNILADFEVIGTDNIPKSGPLLVVGNHFSFLDPVVLIEVLPLFLEFIGGTELPGAPPIVRFIPRLWGTFKVHRGSVSRDALHQAEMILSRGGVMCIFPEAGSWATVLRPARPGAALLAVRSGALILPVGLQGVNHVFPIRFGRKAKIKIQFGTPFGPYTGVIKNRDSREKLDELGHEMMRKIRDLIPVEQHGYYSDNPKIRAAAKGTEIYPWDATKER